VAQEHLHQRELPRRQLDDPVIDGGAPRAEVQRDAAAEQHTGLGGDAFAQAQSHAGEQLLEAERLGHVVIGAPVEPRHRVVDAVPGGDHDDGQPRREEVTRISSSSHGTNA